MRYARGIGYDLLLFESSDDCDIYVGPGLLLVFDGYVEVDGKVVSAGYGAEFDGAVHVVGRDVYAAVAQEIHTPLDVRKPGMVCIAELIEHSKPWGYEREVRSTRKMIQLKILVVREGEATSRQYHERKDEVILFVQTSDGHPYEPRRPWYVSPGRIHRVDGDDGRRVCVEASTYEPDDVVRLDDKYGRDDM